MLMAAESNAASNTLSFDSIYHQLIVYSQSDNHGSKPPQSQGKFKMAAGGVGWKDAASGNVVTVRQEEVRQAVWVRGYFSGYSLLFTMIPASGANKSVMKMHAFHGFNADVRDQIEQFIKDNYTNCPFVPQALDKRGWNWGSLDVDSESIAFYAGREESDGSQDNPAAAVFTIPLPAVSNVSLTGRAEVCLKLSDPLIQEVCLHVPGKTVVESDTEDGGSDDDTALTEEQKMERELLKEKVDSAAVLCNTIKNAAGLEDSASESIVTLIDVSCMIPRGRYDVDFGASGVRLHGKTYDHRILYNNILKLIILPKADDYHVLVVAQLDPPLRHGQTRYPFLVFSLPKDEITEVEVSNVETAKEKKLQTKYDGPTFEILASLFRQLAGQKILTPAADIKFSSSHLPCVRCTNRASEGHLYPLERALFYLPKPTVIIPYTDIANVVLIRAGMGIGVSRSFDMKIAIKGTGNDLQLGGIPREDLGAIQDLFSAKGVHVIDESEDTKSAAKSKKRYRERDDENKSDDEAIIREDGVDEESTDDDYVEDGESDGSEVDEEYDEDYESEDEDDEVSDEASDEASDDDIEEGETD